MEEKKPVDWEAMENDWRAGVISVLRLSNEYGVSRAAIIKHWGKLGIERDLTAKIQAKADALVTQAQVTHRLHVTERQVVEANAEAVAIVILGQRGSISRLDKIINLLFDRLEKELSGTELFSQLGELMASPDSKNSDRLNDLYRKVIDLPSQTDTAKKLAETLKTKIELERKVFKIDDQQSDASEHMREFIEYLSGTSSRIPVRV